MSAHSFTEAIPRPELVITGGLPNGCSVECFFEDRKRAMTYRVITPTGSDEETVPRLNFSGDIINREAQIVCRIYAKLQSKSNP